MTAKMMETHISWIILTGKYAYKIKKPLELGFLDYSSLAKRKFYCEEELRLNKIYAPELYLKIVGIKINNKIIDYAVVMNQFDQQYLFLNLLKSHELLPEYFMDLANQMAEFHQTAEIAPGKFGSLENTWFPVQQNFDQIRPYLEQAGEESQKLLSQLKICESWAVAQFEKYKKIFKSRKKNNFIRECHGDLHLGNIVLYKNKPVIFDRIEFNDNLRYTDTMADIGFLLMDLDEKGQKQWGNIFLNQYLTLTGDYEGLAVLKFYEAYRAVVRAKIKLMGPKIAWEDYKLSINLAQKYTDSNKKPELFIMHGVAGSGKTTRAKKLTHDKQLIHIRSDVERKRICQDKNKLYTEAINRKVYDRLYELSEFLLNLGYSVVVDATFLKKAHRDKFRQLSDAFHIVVCEVDDKLRKTWLNNRTQDYSDADFEIAQQQQNNCEPLTGEERKYIYV